MTKYKVRIERRSDGWWIVGDPLLGFDDMGPYLTKAEAEDDGAGVARTVVTDEWQQTLRGCDVNDNVPA